LDDHNSLPEFTDADFRDFVRIVQQTALQAYPNPDRIGCPDPREIHEIAIQEWPSEHPLFRSHVAQCSPCIAAVLEERTRFQREKKKHRRRIIIASAAFAAVACSVAVAFLLVRTEPSKRILERAHTAAQPPIPTPTPVLPEAARNPIEVALDVRSASPTRSAGQRQVPLFSVPAAFANLRMTLPLGMEAGPYDVVIQSSDGQNVINARGEATMTAGTTVLKVAIDLSRLAPGEYAFLYRHLNEAQHRIAILVTK
jgi:hypothetical protein